MQSHLLVIDDDAALRYSIRKSLADERLRVTEAASAEDGLEKLAADTPDVILLDLRLNDSSGVDLLKGIRAFNPDVPVIMFTAYSTTASTIEAAKHGAFDYLLKPVDFAVLTETIDRALASRRVPTGTRIASASGAPAGDETPMIGSSPKMQELYKLLGRFAPTSGNVLLLGESGTGKELAARAVHNHSGRRGGPFVAINCAALPETLLESELFGHEKGAFTGADKRRVGKFEHAAGGTLFLDEVADTSPATQAKLLRVLQDRRFERLGGNDTLEADVRVVAATNKDLDAMVAAGTFRGDLLYRLNVLTIRIPPLRERREDIAGLATFFLATYKAEFGKERLELDPEVLTLLESYDWPGNVRELQSSIRFALAHATGSVIRLEHLPQSLQAQRRAGASRGPVPSEATGLVALIDRLLDENSRNVYGSLIGHVERVLLPHVLERTNGNLQQACDRLGISRNTLKTKMREHGISLEHRCLSKFDSTSQILKELR